MNVIKLADAKKEMNEVRCKYCRRLLFYGDVKEIQIKCPKCGRILEIIHYDENQ